MSNALRISNTILVDEEQQRKSQDLTLVCVPEKMSYKEQCKAEYLASDECRGFCNCSI